MHTTPTIEVAKARARLIARYEPRRAGDLLVASGVPPRDAIRFVLMARRAPACHG